MIFAEFLYTCELERKVNNFDIVKCYWAAYSKIKKTLTTEKTSMIIIRIAITDIRHVRYCV